MKDKFTIWLKNKINSTPTEPPAEVWTNISNQLDVNASWSTLDKKLDIDTVWGRLEKQLVVDKRMAQIERISYAPYLLLLMFFGWLTISEQFTDEKIIADSATLTETAKSPEVNLQNLKPLISEASGPLANSNNPKNKKQEQERKSRRLVEETQEQKTVLAETATAGTEIQKTVGSKPRAATEQPSANIQVGEATPQSIFTEEDKATQTYEDRSALNSVELMDINKGDKNKAFIKRSPFPSNIEYDSILMEERTPDSLGLPQKSSENIRGDKYWYAGLGISGSRTRLNDNRLKRAAEGSSSFNAIATNDISMNLQLGYVFNEVWAMHSDISFFGKVGQEYGEYIDGKYREGRVDVNYNGLKLGIKRQLPQLIIPGHGVKNYLLLGVYANHINRVQQEEKIFINRETREIDLTDYYNNFDFGLWAGLELSGEISPAFELGTLLSYRYGLDNIYKGNIGIPAYLRRTTTSEITLTLFLRRNFKKF